MKMKSFILLSLFFPIIVNAQIQITPEVGTSIYKEGNSKEKATISPRIGVGVDYFFNQQKTGGD